MAWVIAIAITTTAQELMPVGNNCLLVTLFSHTTRTFRRTPTRYLATAQSYTGTNSILPVTTLSLGGYPEDKFTDKVAVVVVVIALMS
jgi:hypothetical protein